MEAMIWMKFADWFGKILFDSANKIEDTIDNIIMPIVCCSLKKRELIYANIAARQMISVSISYDCISLELLG